MMNYFIYRHEADEKHPKSESIYMRLSDGGWSVFEPTEGNPNTSAYLAWVAEGNEAQTWD